jgi:hypothetical protein
MKGGRLSQAQMSECKYREVRLNCFWRPQDLFLMNSENVGVADGPGMTVESQDFIVEMMGEM